MPSFEFEDGMRSPKRKSNIATGTHTVNTNSLPETNRNVQE